MNMTLFHALPAAAALALGSAGAQAADIQVPADRPTIQEGIAAAGDGDRVLVAPGTYFENIEFLGRDIQVIGTEGAENTIIDAGRHGSVVRFHGHETRETLLSGFTIQGGATKFNGGGIYIFNSSPRIEDNVIRSNVACIGAGLSVAYGEPVIRHNRIHHNVSRCANGGAGPGGGIFVSSGEHVSIEENRIDHNEAAEGGGIDVSVSDLTGAAVISHNIIESNTVSDVGGGLSLNASSARVIGNLIVNNSALRGGGIDVVASFLQHPLMINDTIADNVGEGLYITVLYGGVVSVVNTIVRASNTSAAVYCFVVSDGKAVLDHSMAYTTWAWAVQGPCVLSETSTDLDPDFLGTPEHTYWLQPGSPAVDAGQDLSPKLRKDLSGAPRVSGPAIDIGAYEYQQP
jgi:hypothetical protein